MMAKIRTAIGMGEKAVNAGANEILEIFGDLSRLATTEHNLTPECIRGIKGHSADERPT